MARTLSFIMARTSSAKSELPELVKKRAKTEETLANLERRIYAFEGKYLRDTQLDGNIVFGWDKYLATKRSTSSRAVKRNRKFKQAERIFSKSSITSMVSVNGIVEVERNNKTDIKANSCESDASVEQNTVNCVEFDSSSSSSSSSSSTVDGDWSPQKTSDFTCKRKMVQKVKKNVKMPRMFTDLD